MSEAPPDSITHLEPPTKTTELEDPGAEDTASNSDDDHFSDASEGNTNLQSNPQSGNTSPVPRTRVERVDDSAQYGEITGTTAYEKREQDAVPDEIEVVPEGLDNEQSTSPQSDHESTDSEDTTRPIPETRVTKVDTMPLDEELPSRPRAHSSSPSDAEPDVVETIQHDPETTSQEEAIEEFVDGDGANDFGDDFDEFVDEQENMPDDDFGDFDDGFQEPSTEEEPAPPAAPPSVPPLTDFNVFKSTSDLLSSLQGTLDNLLPASTDLASLPPIEPIPDSAAIFSTERSLSLWSQLVAPPPLQPQNWVKSRIRRLFLVSLGVPVDLDEILPASKQKKLILPSIDLESGVNTPITRSRSQVREGESEGSNAPTGQAPRKRRGAAPAPELDLSAVRRLCDTTDAALGGLTDGELKGHVQELESVTLRASEVLEYWLKRRDGLVGEKEAFEGVIENLVSHVRRVRK